MTDSHTDPFARTEADRLPRMVKLPRIYDPRGSLSFVEQNSHIPFDIQRVYWIYDVPGGEDRGSHSHHRLEQLLVATGGSFDVEVTDGFTRKVYHLNKPFEGLYLPPGFWHTLINFASGSVCMAIVSLPYDEADYIRSYDDYMELARERGSLF